MLLIAHTLLRTSQAHLKMARRHAVVAQMSRPHLASMCDATTMRSMVPLLQAKEYNNYDYIRYLNSEEYQEIKPSRFRPRLGSGANT